MKLMLNNSSGKPDGMWTCAFISFIIVSAVVIFSLFDSLTIGDFSLKFTAPDSTLIGLYLGACFTSYVVRRNKKDQLESETETTDSNVTE